MLVTSDRYPRHAVTTPAAITHTKGTSRTATDSALNRRHMPPNAAGTRRRFGAREGSVLTWPTGSRT